MLPGRSVGDWSASIMRRFPARADSPSADDRLPQITLRPARSRSRRRPGRCLSSSRACAEARMRTSQPPARSGSCRIRERFRTSCHSPVRGASAAAVTSTAPVVPSGQTIFKSYMLGLEPSSCSSTEQPGSAARMHTCAASSSLRTLAMTPSWGTGGRKREPTRVGALGKRPRDNYDAALITGNQRSTGSAAPCRAGCIGLLLAC